MTSNNVKKLVYFQQADDEDPIVVLVSTTSIRILAPDNGSCSVFRARREK
jgi:hypothetical protein